MPLWVELYLLGILGIGISEVWHNIHAQRPRWHVLLDTANKLLILMTGIAYWHPGLGQSLSPAAFTCFILGVAWLPIELKTELASGKLNNPDISPTGNLVVLICALTLALALFAPLYYWGFLYAVQGLSAQPFS